MSSSVFPSAHDSKYDRQLRLWGSHGQAALESAHIAVLGSSGTAAEALKNLVLPNIGKFTIIDNAIVTEADLGQNFFVTSDWLGKSRSEAVKVLLSELNAEVQGHHIHHNPLDIIHNRLESFAQYDLVLATQGPCHAYLPLADYLYQRNIPFIYLRSYGLLGHVRLQIREHFIVESHPSNDRYDLYIHPQQLVNWPELKAYCDQFPLDKPIRMQNNNQTDNAMNSAAAPDGNANAPNDQTASSSSSLLVSPLGMDSEEHSHVPYIAILHHVSHLHTKRRSISSS
jgi:molybdopterin/thiamine biosynthesis adenylyltransferase